MIKIRINKILKQWGIDVPNDVWFPEHLKDNFKNKFFYIDKLPFSVDISNAAKFDQVDFFFQEVLEGKISKQIFVALEEKYTNMLTKLWLYNKVFVESLLLSELDIEKYINIIDKQYLNVLKEIKREYKLSGFLEVSRKDYLELLIQLNSRDVIDTYFYFSEFEMIIVPSWSCYMIYLNDLTKYQLVKDIVVSEGLFLRGDQL